MPEMFLVEGIWHGADNPQAGYVSDDSDFRPSSAKPALRVVRTDRFLAGGEINIGRDDTVLMFYGIKKANQLAALCEDHRLKHHPNKNASFKVIKKHIGLGLLQLNQAKGYVYSWEAE